MNAQSSSNFNVGVAPELIGAVSFGGLRAYGLGYAVDPDNEGTIYLSLVGYRTAVRGVWAALMDNQAIELGSQLFRRMQGTYLSKTVQLPESGLDHLALLHHQAATPYLEAGQPFYLLNSTTLDISKNEMPHVADRFFAMLDRATAVPLDSSWSEWLFRQGLKHQLIEPLSDRRGIEGWRVSADSELWLALIEKGIQQNRIATQKKGKSK
jgi:hypothetical protein